VQAPAIPYRQARSSQHSLQMNVNPNHRHRFGVGYDLQTASVRATWARMDTRPAYRQLIRLFDAANFVRNQYSLRTASTTFNRIALLANRVGHLLTPAPGLIRWVPRSLLGFKVFLEVRNGDLTATIQNLGDDSDEEESEEEDSDEEDSDSD